MAEATVHKCDLSLFPIVYIFVAGAVDTEGAQAITASVEDALRRAEREGVQMFQLINGLHVSGVTPLARKAVSEWDQSLDQALFERLSARIVLTDSMVIRGAITAISWFSARMKTASSVKSIDEGIETIRERMKAVGMAMTAEQVARLKTLHAEAEADFRAA